MDLNKDKSLALIILSVFMFVNNSMGLLMARFAFNDPDQRDSVPQIFYIVCGFMMLISLAGLGYGIFLRKKTK
ncbi:hypothetical protein IV494_05415 [Kaistella sp. G5-32]|uniref:Secreted protein with PEP-CTERM sorting signal n=1 Tax=Kaistella gelatinilytica TaxID=2787636 RepID=A0ABS0FAD3_9FLAO|nr:hypothetical protein [Kaistella gelatinilytica]MBF8456616.1 hypothetical protein [Kaistella gelatinilytica]